MATAAASTASNPQANKAAFEEGVKYIIESWTALRLAVEQDWGGVDSAEKRDWMIDVIVDYFGKNGKKLDIVDIEDILSQIMTDEFLTILEDDSAYLVAKHLVEIYNQCIHGNFTEVERLREKCQSRSQVAASCVQQQDGSDSEDTDGEEDDHEEDGMDVDTGSSERAQPEEDEVDEDGFITVRRKK
ncbi:Pre-rRNA-processing protein TSR2-domain-containing protein [Radiomyces spectabilis]|uniref:Pre-rRNA-processing protein TSR2-domain-containing protein n=1 Tax=Radiomyces spectabilis TaxID=64574 RepID=UPI00222116F2|nr:Pre-rRNA-processing protein TSR2-domain-containing protein [Radiomyces spectabilis]KAI8388675.1 Pre-rRNA-processing protein TSR2-domain-containing protein [Radiomyces spectabilis]